MTPLAHYTEAERLLDKCEEDHVTIGMHERWIAQAQVHAQLASLISLQGEDAEHDIDPAIWKVYP